MNVLYLSYNGLLEPLGQSQVLAYLRDLASVHGHRFHVMSYEKPRHWADRALIRQQRAALPAGVTWHPLLYHQRPTVPATLYDVLRGLPLALRLAQRQRIETVHVRSYVPMVIGIALKNLLGIRLIFDMRGLWADERADVGACTRQSRQYRAIKALERNSFRSSDHIIMLTKRVQHELQSQTAPGTTTVIPCCADLQRFRPDAALRQEMRQQHSWQDQTVLVSSGSLGGWYMTDELAQVYAQWSRQHPRLHLLILTHSDPALIVGPLERYGVAANRYTVQAAPASEVPRWLAAADGAVMLIQPWYSKIASSPTKQAEYLGCGLPIVANAGVGDGDTLLRDNAVGVVFDRWDPAALQRTFATFLGLMNDPGTWQRCRALAEAELDLRTGVERYHRVYQALANESGV